MMTEEQVDEHVFDMLEALKEKKMPVAAFLKVREECDSDRDFSQLLVVLTELTLVSTASDMAKALATGDEDAAVEAAQEAHGRRLAHLEQLFVLAMWTGRNG